MSRAPDPIDVHVASRLRMRRMMLGVSQEALAARIGVTFQQIQKYEKGQNRVGASRLYQLSEALGVPVGHFYEGLPTAGVEGGEIDAAVLAALTTPEGVQLHMTFARLGSAVIRRRIVELLVALVEDEQRRPGDGSSIVSAQG